MKVYAFSTVAAGHDMITLLKGRFPLTGLIAPAGVEPTTALASLTWTQELASGLDLTFIGLRSSDLSNASDRQALEALSPDLIIVIGWHQKLPSWFLEMPRMGCIGIHGSAWGIEKVRGWAPQSWAMILGHRSFALSLYRLKSTGGIGPILKTLSFELESLDDSLSAYLKVNLGAVALLTEAYAEGLFLEPVEDSDNDSPVYTPGRISEDGEIDWTRSTVEIYNFIRAQTHPYSGAYTQLEQGRLTIWRSRPLAYSSAYLRANTGEIVHVLSSGEFIVGTGDGLLLVDDYTITPVGSFRLNCGKKLPSARYQDQIAAIVGRHQATHPHLPLISELGAS
jgi:methionyl-tRNA formyltransferase